MQGSAVWFQGWISIWWIPCHFFLFSPPLLKLLTYDETLSLFLEKNLESSDHIKKYHQVLLCFPMLVIQRSFRGHDSTCTKGFTSHTSCDCFSVVFDFLRFYHCSFFGGNSDTFALLRLHTPSHCIWNETEQDVSPTLVQEFCQRHCMCDK